MRCRCGRFVCATQLPPLCERCWDKAWDEFIAACDELAVAFA